MVEDFRESSFPSVVPCIRLLSFLFLCDERNFNFPGLFKVGESDAMFSALGDVERGSGQSENLKS